MPEIMEVVERFVVPDLPKIELPSEDGLPFESNWHRIQINLLIDCTRQHWRGQTNFFAGGNMFIYYSTRQARTRDYKGPDFFVVKQCRQQGPSRMDRLGRRGPLPQRYPRIAIAQYCFRRPGFQEGFVRADIQDAGIFLLRPGHSNPAGLAARSSPDLRTSESGRERAFLQ